jgi:hypothetical protein
VEVVTPLMVIASSLLWIRTKSEDKTDYLPNKHR